MPGSACEDVIFYHCTLNFSALKNPAESKSEHEITVPVEVEATANVVNTESSDDMYEVVEMQVTSSSGSKARNSPAQMPQEDSAKTQHVETEVHNIGTEDTAGNGDNQEAYEIMNVD